MIEKNLTDQNFDQFIQSSEKPVLVDFWAQWCMPCLALGPVLEKVAQEYGDKLILAKVNLDAVPQTAQKYGIEQIPTVILFKNGKPVSGFIGLRPEPIIKEFLDEALKKDLPSEIPENIEETLKDYQIYAEKNGFKLNPDAETVERLVTGLLKNEKKHGVRYCPCRRISGNPEEDRSKICPCQWHKEEIEKDGHCLCGLFVKGS
jgi:thioredoxin